MARAPARRPTEAPARNDAYVGMLFLTCVSMAVGIAVLALEGQEYDWVSEPPKSGPAITLPSLAPKAPDAAGTTAAPAPAAPVVAVAPAPGPAPRPAPVLAPLAPAVASRMPAVAVPAVPELAPAPGFSIPTPPVAAGPLPALPPVPR